MTGYKRGYMYAPDPPDPGEEREELEGGWPTIIIYLLIAGVALAALGGMFAFAYVSISSDGSEHEPQKIEKIVRWPDMQGDDNNDGHIDETESGWSCETMGDLKCGPNEHRMRLS